MSQRAEKLKSVLISLHEPIRIVLLLMLLVFGFFALRSWKNANDVVGSTNAAIQDTFVDIRATIQNLNDKISAIDAAKINRQADDLHVATAEATKLITSITEQTEKLTGAATARVNQLGENLISLKKVTDEIHFQTKQIGDSATDTFHSVGILVNKTNTRISKILDDGTIMLETINPQLKDILSHADAVIITADGTIKAYEPVGVKLASTLGHLDNMAADSDTRWHGLLFPPPVKGFWNHTKQIATFVLHSVFDGLNLYYKITALPVKITQPIPVLK